MPRSIPLIDSVVKRVAPLLPGVSGSGVFHYGRLRSSFMGAWSEGDSLCLRLGRVEVVLDLA